MWLCRLYGLVLANWCAVGDAFIRVLSTIELWQHIKPTVFVIALKALEPPQGHAKAGRLNPEPNVCPLLSKAP